MQLPLSRLAVLWALILANVSSISLSAADTPDEAAIRQLNDDYLRSFLKSDVARYRELLTEDFRAVLSDGRMIDKAEFLRQAAVPPQVTGFRLEEVLIRVYGDTAVVNGLVRYARPDGTPVLTRYTDTFVRTQGNWRVVAAQLTRVAAAAP